MPQKEDPLPPANTEAKPPSNQPQNMRQRMETTNDDIIYDSSSRGCAYKFLRLLWCGCFEPYHHITAQYVETDYWKGCEQVTDTMAFENIFDVRREQSCCCVIANFLPCFYCCLDDIGDIVIYGTDESDRLASGENSRQNKLIHVSQSFDTFEKITAHLQEIHQGWRKAGRKIGRNLEQIKDMQ